MLKPDNPWQHGKSIWNWVRTGEMSVSRERSTKSGSPRLAAAKLKFALADGFEYKVNVWATLVQLSRGQLRARLTGNTFNSLYGDIPPSTEKTQPSLTFRIASGIRTGLLGIVQALDFLVYLPAFISAAGQLGFESLYRFIGFQLGLFAIGKGDYTDTPLKGWRVGLAWTALIVVGIFAFAFRVATFALQSLAWGFGLLLNIGNIAVTAVSTLITMGIKAITKSPDLGSYTKIMRGMLADMAFPFSWDRGNAMAQHVRISDTGKLGQEMQRNLSDNAIETPDFNWRKVFGYAVAGAVVFAVSGPLGIGAVPHIPAMAEFAVGLVGVIHNIFIDLAVRISIGGVIFNSISSFIENPVKIFQNLFATEKMSVRSGAPVIPAGAETEEVLERAAMPQEEAESEVKDKFRKQIDSTDSYTVDDDSDNDIDSLKISSTGSGSQNDAEKNKNEDEDPEGIKYYGPINPKK